MAVLPLAEPAVAVAARAVTIRQGRRHLSRLPGDASQRRPRLSAGERRALAHYVQGLTTVQVAAEMGVGYETAKTFLRRVRAKYAAVDRAAGKRAQLVERDTRMASSSRGEALLPVRGDELRQVDGAAAGRLQLRGARPARAAREASDRHEGRARHRLPARRDPGSRLPGGAGGVGRGRFERRGLRARRAGRVPALDEAQFLTPGQVDDLLRIAVDRGRAGDRLRHPHRLPDARVPRQSARLLEIAHSLEELKTICRCGRKAMFNARKIGDGFVFDGDQVAIDGEASHLRVAVRHLLPARRAAARLRLTRARHETGRDSPRNKLAPRGPPPHGRGDRI